MTEKVVVLALTGEAACFAHALLNTLDMQKRGIEVKMVIEGAATRLIKELADPQKPFAPLYAKVVEARLIDCVCRACCKILGSL
ncbi:MAG: cytoplasmic protein, partial [Thermodesulfobacteriota bacterium]